MRWRRAFTGVSQFLRLFAIARGKPPLPSRLLEIEAFPCVLPVFWNRFAASVKHHDSPYDCTIRIGWLSPAAKVRRIQTQTQTLLEPHPASKRSPRQEPPLVSPQASARADPLSALLQAEAPNQRSRPCATAFLLQARSVNPYHFRNLPSERLPRPVNQRVRAYLVKVRPGLLSLQSEDTFQTLATRDSFGPTGARLMSIHPLAG